MREERRSAVTPAPPPPRAARYRARAFFAVTLLAAWVTTGCHRYQSGRSLVSDVEVVTEVDEEESDVIDRDELLEGLATARPAPFLGIVHGVLVQYDVFDEALLARDLERIERYYHARGYYEAKVTATRVVPTSSGEAKEQNPKVLIQIRVHEGDPVRIAQRVRLTGIERLPLTPVGMAVLRAVTLEEGQILDEREFENTKEAIAEALADRGYAFAVVHGRVQIDLTRHQAVVSYEVTPGPRAVYGKITIVGRGEIPERPIRAALLIREGMLYSRADLKEAEDALKSLGVFASVEVRQDLTKAAQAQVPITVVLRPSALRTVRLGAGARADPLELSNHLRLGWEDRNFLGGMRRFSVDTRPGVVYFPLRIGRRWESHIRLLPRNRLNVALRQPAFLEGRTTGLLSGEYNVYPLLYQLPAGMDPREERIIGYHELKARTGVERSFFNFHLKAIPSYNYRANFPFLYQTEVMPAGLDPVRVAYPELEVALDFRDDAIFPHRGVLISNSVQVAGLPTGGDVKDVRVQPALLAFLPMSKYVTLALRGTVGFLFPFDYGESLDPAEGVSPSDAAVVRDQHKLLFRVFYSGGPGSNRGYPFRGVGPHGPLGFLVPSTQRCEFDGPNPSSCLRPLGGLSLWESTLEVRFPIVGPLRAATFFDASHVTRQEANLRFDVPHLSTGVGVRYMSPVGPLRVDLGWHLVRSFVEDDPDTPEVNEADEALAGEPTLKPLFGVSWLPKAIHIAIGEAF